MNWSDWRNTRPADDSKPIDVACWANNGGDGRPSRRTSMPTLSADVPMSLIQHWRRGALMCAILALVVAASVIGALLGVAIVLLPIEAFISNGAAGGLEDQYLIPGVSILTIILLPLFLSQAQGQLATIP